MKTTIVLNFIRSANAPQINAGVMMKNIPWNSMWVSRGMEPSIGVRTSWSDSTHCDCTPRMHR